MERLEKFICGEKEKGKGEKEETMHDFAAIVEVFWHPKVNVKSYLFTDLHLFQLILPKVGIKKNNKLCLCLQFYLLD